MSIGSLRQPALVPGYQVEYRAKVLGEGPEGGVPQLHEVTKTLTEKLDDVIRGLK
jgi:hypothetical protein